MQQSCLVGMIGPVAMVAMVGHCPPRLACGNISRELALHAL